jgi:hypothetical protein
VTSPPGLHVLLERDADVPCTPLGEHVHVHTLLDRPGTGIVAVRPDGYVGFSSGTADAAALRRWLRLVNATPSAPGSRASGLAGPV